jgi:hypothetical protein
MKKIPEFWYNYVSKSYTILQRDEKFPQSDKEAIQFIPNTRFSRSAYRLFRKNKHTIRESMLLVLSLFLKED